MYMETKETIATQGFYPFLVPFVKINFFPLAEKKTYTHASPYLLLIIKNGGTSVEVFFWFYSFNYVGISTVLLSKTISVKCSLKINGQT